MIVRPRAKRCRAKDIGRAGDRRAVRASQMNSRAAQLRGASDDMALLNSQVGSQGSQAVQMQIDRPFANLTTAGQWHHGSAAPGQQRTEHAEAGPHLLHQFVVGKDVLRSDGGDLHRIVALAFDFDAQVAEQEREGVDVGQMRNVARAPPARRPGSSRP